MVQRPLVLELEGAQLAGAAVAVGLGAELGDEDRLARIERVRAVEERTEVDGPRRAAGPGGAIPAEVLVGADYVQPLDGWGGVGLTEDRLAVDADPAAGIEAADRRAGLVDEDLVVPLGGLVEEGAAGVLAGDLVGHRPGEDRGVVDAGVDRVAVGLDGASADAPDHLLRAHLVDRRLGPEQDPRAV